MRAILSIALFAGAFVLMSHSAGDPNLNWPLEPKHPLADALMMNVNGTQMSLETAAGPNGVLVVFSCNTCPFVVGNGEKSDGWEGRYNDTALSQKTTVFRWFWSTPTKPSETTTIAWRR